MRAAFVSVALSCVILVATAKAGTLCLMGEACLESRSITPVDHSRLYVWTNVKDHIAVLGVVPPNAMSVTPEAEAAVQMSLAARDRDRWPAPVKVTIRDAQQN